MSKELSIIIADDDTVFPFGLTIILLNINRKFKIRIAKNGMDLIDQMREKRADIIFLDYNMPEMTGSEAAPIINREFPEAAIIVCTYFREIETVRKMMSAKIKGYILKESKKDKIQKALEIVVQGGEYYSEEIKEIISSIMSDSSELSQPKEEKNKYSERELEIIKLVCQKYSNQQIADKLFISKRTVETHLHNIYIVSGTNSHESLIAYASKHLLDKVI